MISERRTILIEGQSDRRLPSSSSGLPSAVCRLSSGFRRPPSSSRSGIALVMVLGILSVMVIMAVAFAISMRTERVAAGNYADSVRARQLVHVGLARALNDLAMNLGTNGLMGQPGPNYVYPPWTVTNSYTNAYTNTSAYLYLVHATNDSPRANEAINFVPRALWDAATNQDFISAPNHWLPVDSLIYTNDPAVGPPAESNRMGRVKYLILNCSGLLDANFAGGAARLFGESPKEIAVNQLGEFTGNFTNQRNTDVRYETLNELAVRNNSQPTNFCVYSYCPAGYWDAGTVRTQVNLAGTAADMPAGSVRWRAITNAFYLADFSGSEAGVLYRNLIDYIDPDCNPNLDTTCVEPVPMINEMVFSNTVDYSAVPSPVWSVSCGVSFELWYPFVSGGGTYSFTANVAFVSSAGAGTLSVGGRQNNLALSPAQPFNVIDFNASNNFGSDPVTFNVLINAAVVMSGTNELDKLNTPCTVFSGMTKNGPRIGLECLDPRFNHYPNNPNSWRQASLITLSKVNDWTSSYLASPTNTGDTNTEMYVANTSLQSVAELGYLVYSSNYPWHTVKLYGPNLRRVLDVFGLSTNAGDIFITNTTVYRGLVNCNPNVATDATAVVFAGMPVDQYPGGPSNLLTMTPSRNFAANIFAGGLFTNLSDVGRNLNEASFPVGATELEREAYFRNAFNLLNLRQNLFTIIIEAHVASGGNIPSRPIRQRAVALVWRDPYTGEMFVRSIKWLKD